MARDCVKFAFLFPELVHIKLEMKACRPSYSQGQRGGYLSTHGVLAAHITTNKSTWFKALSYCAAVMSRCTPTGAFD